LSSGIFSRATRKTEALGRNNGTQNLLDPQDWKREAKNFDKLT